MFFYVAFCKADQVWGIDQSYFHRFFFRFSRPAICRAATRRIIQKAPTRIAAVQCMNAGRFSGSSVIFRNSSTCSSLGSPTTGMLK